ncbi:MAG: hypothetical protein JW888_16145 [Pirellulales bacterium]|nr:hypothetical protein [Pirellulales bacterium]
MADNRLEPMDRAAAAEAIRKWSEDDLRYLNRLIVERLKLIHQARSTVMLANFNVGDRVRFPTGAGDEKTGVIIRLNKKTASIATDDGHRWNVHPVFLIDDASPKAENAAQRPVAGIEREGGHGG